jgi:MFS family permease
LSPLFRMFNSFRYSDYGWLWLIVAFANAGVWSFTLVVTMQVYNLTHSSFWSGALVFASMAPNIVGAPIAGVLADKMQRRVLMLVAVILSLIVLVVLYFMTITHVLSPIGMVIMALVFGLASSTVSVSVNALIPTLVPRDGLYNAYSLQAVGQRGTEFVGPILAAPLYAMYGAQSVYLFCAAIYLVTVVLILRFRVPHIQVMDREAFMRSFARGFHYIRASRSLSAMIVLVGLHCALTMAFLGMLPVFVQKNLGLSTHSSFYGTLMSMIGLGAIVGTLVLAAVTSHKMRTSLFWVSAVVSGLSLTWFGWSSTPALAIAAILVVGSSQAVFMTITIAMVQESTEEAVRGRVSGVYLVLAGGLMSLANWLYGALGVSIQPRFIMLTTGLLFTLIVAAYWYLFARRAEPVTSDATSNVTSDVPSPAADFS